MNNTPAALTGANVRAEMARRRISQAELGEHLGLKQASISARLSGHTAFNINELHRVAAFFDVPLAVLTDGVAA